MLQGTACEKTWAKDLGVFEEIKNLIGLEVRVEKG